MVEPMGELARYLDQILDRHTKIGSPLAQHLQPGLRIDQIRAKIADLPFKMPEEFVELYAWRNGTPASERGWISFIEFHRFLPLEEALEAFSESYPIVKHFYELSDWVMTFEDGSGDGYGISAAKRESPSAPIVFLFQGDGVNVVFESLTQMMKTMLAAFDAGVFSMGEAGDLATDFYKLGEVAHKLNPTTFYWKQYASYRKKV